MSDTCSLCVISIWRHSSCHDGNILSHQPHFRCFLSIRSRTASRSSCEMISDSWYVPHSLQYFFISPPFMIDTTRAYWCVHNRKVTIPSGALLRLYSPVRDLSHQSNSSRDSASVIPRSSTLPSSPALRIIMLIRVTSLLILICKFVYSGPSSGLT